MENLACAGLSLSVWNLDLCVRIMTDLSDPGKGMQYLPRSSFQKREPRGRSLGEVWVAIQWKLNMIDKRNIVITFCSKNGFIISA